MLNFKKNLVLRITLPIIILNLALGAVLYFFVLTTVSEFVEKDIQQDLASQSRRAYNICNINFETLLLSGLANDQDTLIIKQALVLGQIEDFFRQENLHGLVFDTKTKKMIFQTELPTTWEHLIDFEYDRNKFITLEVQKEKYFAYFSDFQPWNWHIVIVKNSKVYSNLLTRVQRVYLYTIASLMMVVFLMIFFIFKYINQPIRTIVRTIQNNQKPDYKGIDVFEFLSNTISAMMLSIQQSKEKYQMLVETSNHLVWEIDPYSRYTFVSPTALTILGFHPNEIIGKTPFDFMALDEAERIGKQYTKIIAQRASIDGLISVNTHKNGQIVILETTGVPIFNTHGEFSGYRGINRDITERVEAEQEKINAQKTAAEQAKLALVGQVAGKMAHDFNNVLGVIMGNAELSLMDCQDKKIEKTLELIFNQTIRGKNLTKNLIAFARDQEPKQEFFKMDEKIDLVLSLLKKELEGIELITQNNQDLPDLLADPGMIEHALINLIQNSIHATSLSEKPRIIMRTSCLDDNICFEIEDNGCGIAKEHLDKIYDPSFTLKGSKDIAGSYKTGIQGTGYGMSNIKKYIEQHRGKIFVESKAGSGTKFTIHLPVIKKALTSEEKMQIQKEHPQSNKRILVVEDEPAISGVLYKILSQAPCRHKVDIANDGKAAMELFEKNIYDLVSLDYVLPGRINGMDVYDHIRTINKTIPILFISGNIEFLESIKELKQKDRHIDHQSKPCQNKDYINSINKLFKIKIKMPQINIREK